MLPIKFLPEEHHVVEGFLEVSLYTLSLKSEHYPHKLLGCFLLPPESVVLHDSLDVTKHVLNGRELWGIRGQQKHGCPVLLHDPHYEARLVCSQVIKYKH